ncbi:MAG: hypothetical protein ACFB5Z_09030 [Elainellaceae cyanobacterium]
MDAPSNLRRDSCFYVSGDVQVHPSAAIAPGAFLQADAGSRLVIGPGVSVGSGVLLHAQDGVLSLAARVTLGTGVLVMGQGRIGAGACVGANTTLLFKVAVEPDQLIPAGSIVGGEQVFDGQALLGDIFVEGSRLEAAPPKDEPTGDPPIEGSTAPSDGVAQAQRSTQVYGRVVVERLMRMMSSRQPLDRT